MKYHTGYLAYSFGFRHERITDMGCKTQLDSTMHTGCAVRHHSLQCQVFMWNTTASLVKVSLG